MQPPKKYRHGKNREFGNVNVAKIKEVWFDQVVNSLIVNIQDIVIFSTKLSDYS